MSLNILQRTGQPLTTKTRPTHVCLLGLQDQAPQPERLGQRGAVSQFSRLGQLLLRAVREASVPGLSPGLAGVRLPASLHIVFPVCIRVF